MKERDFRPRQASGKRASLGSRLGRHLGTHIYNKDFFDWLDRNAQFSARAIIDLLTKQLPIQSVLDVGCGRGMWLAEWQLSGVKDMHGLDGDYVNLSNLVIPAELFTAVDLSQPFSLKREFDLVQSLEVAEHLPNTSANNHIDSLIGHAEIVLFSAASPGQGGEFHVNEQPSEYWREKFEARGYHAFDYIRPRIKSEKAVSYWYRFNTVLYATTRASESFPAEIKSSLVPTGTALPNMAPLAWNLRSKILKLFPPTIVTRLSRFRYQAANLLHKNTSSDDI